MVSWRWMRVITVEPRSEASRERARWRDSSEKRRWRTGCNGASMMSSLRVLTISVVLAVPLQRHFRTNDTPHECGKTKTGPAAALKTLVETLPNLMHCITPKPLEPTPMRVGLPSS